MADTDIQAFHLNEEFEATWGFSIAVRAGQTLYIGGLVSSADDGSALGPDDPELQVRTIYEKLKTVLAARGATFRNVVEETIYVLDFERLGDALGIRAEFYAKDGAEMPSTCGVQVAGLSLEGLLLEVRAVAYLGSVGD